MVEIASHQPFFILVYIYNEILLYHKKLNNAFAATWGLSSLEIIILCEVSQKKDKYYGYHLYVVKYDTNELLCPT